MFSVLPVNASAAPAYAEELKAMKKNAVAVNTDHVLNKAGSTNVRVAALWGPSESGSANVSALPNAAGATAEKAAEVFGPSRTSMAPGTDSGDGVQLLKYPNNSGFEINSNGCSVLYDRSTKTMTLIDSDGACRQVTFSR
jgi:hypothetical protein